MTSESPRRPWPWVVVLLLALVAFASTFVEISSGDRRPVGNAAAVNGLQYQHDINVLFVLVDTLRADRLGSYGYERDTSPTLDYLATTGVRFGRHLAQSSWTKSSMASIWTGLNPIRTGVLRFDHALPSESTMPAEILRDAGFRTAGIWRNGWVAPNFGFDQGFEVYERPGHTELTAAREFRRNNRHVTLAGTDFDLLDNAIEFLRAHSHERWFLYVHLMDLHQYLYDENSALFGSDYSDVYDNSIRHTDDVLGRLLTFLADIGLLEKTLVAISSDHGEAFNERGIEGHAKQVYRESTEVPFILSFPFRLDPGVTLELRSRNVDVWPTILDLLGLPGLADDVDGRSLKPEILAAAQNQPPPAETELAVAHLDRTWGQRRQAPQPAVAVVRDGFRFIYRANANGTSDIQLFDGNSDPLERDNVVSSHPGIAAQLQDEVNLYLEATPPDAWGDGPDRVEIDEMELNQLRALGYEIP